MSRRHDTLFKCGQCDSVHTGAQWDRVTADSHNIEDLKYLLRLGDSKLDGSDYYKCPSCGTEIDSDYIIKIPPKPIANNLEGKHLLKGE